MAGFGGDWEVVAFWYRWMYHWTYHRRYVRMKLPEIIPVTDLRQDAAGILKKLKESKGPLVVTQRGRAIAVIQSVDAYERGERERQLLRQLAAGERDIAAGAGRSLDEVLREADALLDGGGA